MDPWKTSERCVTTNCLDPRGPPLFNSEQVRELTVPKTNRRRHRDRHHHHSHRRVDSTKHFVVDTPANPSAHDLSKIKEEKVGEKEWTAKAKSSPTLVMNPRVGLHSSPLLYPRRVTGETAFPEDPRDDRSSGRKSLGRWAFPYRRTDKTSSDSNAGGVSNDKNGCRRNNRRGIPRIPSFVFRKLLLVIILLVLVAISMLCWTFGKEQILLHQRLINFPTNETTLFRRWGDNWTSLRSLAWQKRRIKGIKMWYDSSFLPDIRRRVKESWQRASDKISSARDAYSSSANRNQHLYYFGEALVKPTLSSLWKTIKHFCFQCLSTLQQVGQASASLVVHIMNTTKLVYRKTVGIAYRNEHSLSPVLMWKSLRNTTFINRKSRFFFWNWVNSTAKASKEYSKLSSTVDMRKERDINDKNCTSNATSSIPQVAIHNNTDSSVIDSYACPGNNNNPSGWAHIQRWHQFVRSLFHSLQNLWSASMLRTSRFFMSVIHFLSPLAHSLHEGGRACLSRISSLFGINRKPPLIPHISTPQSEHNGTSHSSTKLQRKWWRGWAHREGRFSVPFPKIMGKQYWITLCYGIQERIGQWWSHLKLLPHNVLRCIRQKLLSFWNAVKIPPDARNAPKKPKEYVGNNRSKNFSGTGSASSFSFLNSSLGDHAVESTEEKQSYSCQEAHLFYFIRKEEMEKLEVNDDDKESSDVKKVRRESLSRASTARVQQEVAKNLSLRSSALQKFAAETGVFIHFTLAEDELLCHSSTDNQKQKSFRQSSPSHAEHSDVSSLYNSYTSRHPEWRFAPFLFYQLNHSMDLLKAIGPENGMTAMKEEEKEKEGRLLLQKDESKRKNSMNSSEKKGSVECLPCEDEKKWKLERETILAANEKCQREREALLEKQVILQESWCSEKAMDDIKTAIQKESEEKAEELSAILNQQCDERVLEMNTSLYAQWSKTSFERFDLACTQRIQAERKQDNETFTAFLTAQMQENEVLQRKVHELEIKSGIPSSREDQRLPTCPCCTESNSSSQGILYDSQDVSSRLLDAERNAILAVQQAIEMRCSEVCQARQSAPSGNSNTRQQENISSQCITEIARLHERLEDQVTKMFSLPSAEVSSSWKEAALTILQPESLGKYCTLSWNEEYHRDITHCTEAKWGADPSPTAHSIPPLTTSQSLLQCARRIGIRVFWLMIGIGAICVLRGFYFLMEDNARLRCELQQANITVIQERMMNMDGMDGPLYTPPQRMRKSSRKPFLSPDGIEVSKERSMIGASVKEIEEKKETSPRVWDDATMIIPLCYLSPTMETVFDYLSDCHFLQCQLIWNRIKEQQGREKPDNLSSPYIEAKLSLVRSERTLEGKEVPSYVTTPHRLSTTLQQINVDLPPRVVSEINHLFLLLGILFKGYLQGVEDHYVDILDAFFPPELMGGEEINKRRRSTAIHADSNDALTLCTQRSNEMREREVLHAETIIRDYGEAPGNKNNNSSGSSSQCPRPSDDCASMSKHGGERRFLCCYKWRLEAENTKHLMELQAETIRELQQQLENAGC